MLLRATALLSFALLGACSVPARFVAPDSDRETSFSELADQLAEADVVFFGEVHDHADVHTTHQELLAALLKRHPDLVIAMEMFERDTQTALYQYLAGDMDEPEFLATTRPWPNYATDYRPVIEFARANGLPVLAANAPRDLARQVAKEGLAALPKGPLVAAATTAPEDDYWTAFQAAMGSHGGVGDKSAMKRFYEAQCLKDDTMAESIATYVQAARARSERPLVVHFCGQMHSDFRRGTVSRLQSRLPDADIRVLSVDEVEDPKHGLYRADPQVADWVLVVRRQPRPEMPAVAAVKPTHPPVAATDHPTPRERTLNGKPEHPATSTEHPHENIPVRVPGTGARAAGTTPPAGGERPALGLRPDYDAQDRGLRVGGVTDGGPADAAGLHADDLIVGVGGLAVDDIETYAQALDQLKIGETVEVIVKRDVRILKLLVVVGRR
ncbi:MAG: ChaN family lipoprotein [Planctomycetes bacterium]|nr:ChaN family lipoprotein [Planctomycetota bacterium]